LAGLSRTRAVPSRQLPVLQYVFCHHTHCLTKQAARAVGTGGVHGGRPRDTIEMMSSSLSAGTSSAAADKTGAVPQKLPLPDPAGNRYPCCIVWSPLPLITLFIPFIGHLGICDSEGLIYDFAGPYTIGEEFMAFGHPTRYLQLDPGRARRMKWDDGVRRGNAVYRERMHNICWDNCHNHAAECLQAMDYDGPAWWCGRCVRRLIIKARPPIFASSWLSTCNVLWVSK
jgi:hypothetical protein